VDNMAVHPLLTKQYAKSIYQYGTRRFTDRDEYEGIPTEYHEPVKQYAAANFTLELIDNALDQTWINQTEYDETIAYMT